MINKKIIEKLLKFHLAQTELKINKKNNIIQVKLNK